MISSKLRHVYAAANKRLIDIFEKDALITLMFHHVFLNRDEIETGVVEPLQRTLLHDLKICIEYFMKNGYTFVSPEEVITATSPSKKMVMLTFDDGYYNNVRVIPLIEEFDIPAVFFISSGHVEQSKAFWWDVVYRNTVSKGASHKSYMSIITMLKSLKSHEIDKYIRERYGNTGMKPVSDVDRPFTESELRDFSNVTGVVIGNHTYNHDILSLYMPQEIIKSVRESQEYLISTTGKKPSVFSYPSGRYTRDSVNTIMQENFEMAFTTKKLKSYLPIDLSSNKRFLIGRFGLNGKRSIKSQCDICRSDAVTVLNTLKYSIKSEK